MYFFHKSTWGTHISLIFTYGTHGLKEPAKQEYSDCECSVLKHSHLSPNIYVK